jgi:hypothetical protein
MFRSESQCVLASDTNSSLEVIKKETFTTLPGALCEAT